MQIKMIKDVFRVPDEMMSTAVTTMLADAHDPFVKYTHVGFAPGTAVCPSTLYINNNNF